jgi:hypothetical protein
MKFLLVDGVIYDLNLFPCAIFTCGVTILKPIEVKERNL